MKSFKMMGFGPRKSKSGFTLIELLIVMVIIAILAGVIVMAVGGVFGNAKSSAYSTAKEQIQNAVTAYSTNAQNAGALPTLTAWYNTSDCTACHVIDMEAMKSDNTTAAGMLRQVPDGVFYNGTVNNCANIAGGTAPCKDSNHYVWVVNSNGDIYSACIGAGCTLATTGYQNVWP